MAFCELSDIGLGIAIYITYQKPLLELITIVHW
jgi:hypothetical protein